MADTRLMPKTVLGRSTGIGPTRTVVPSSAGAGGNGLSMAPSARYLARAPVPARAQDAKVEIVQRPTPGQAPGQIGRTVTIIAGPGVAPGQGQDPDVVLQVGHSIPDDQRQLVFSILEKYTKACEELNDMAQAQLGKSA